MTDNLNIGQLYPTRLPPGAAAQNKISDRQAQKTLPTQRSFHDVLQDNVNVLKFSRHAEMRLQQRGIKLHPDQLNRIESAVDQAAAKGSKDSLVLMKDMALIINVKTKTVVTAMDGASMKDNVFTKIDSAVIL